VYLITVDAVSTGVGILLLYVQVHVFYAISCATSTADFPQGWEQPVCEADCSHESNVRCKIHGAFPALPLHGRYFQILMVCTFY